MFINNILAMLLSVMIGAISQIISGRGVFESPEIYLYSCGIGLATGFVIEYIYRKYIIRNQLSMWKKYGLAYLVSLLIYVGINIIGEGFAIFALPQFYIIGICILIGVTPIMRLLLRRIDTYSYYLEKKKTE